MKCISIRQPWADLRISGKHLLEVRGYSTPHRGKILIHASNAVDEKLCKKLDAKPTVKGALLGYVELTEIEEKVSAEEWRKTREEHLLDGHRIFGNSTNFWHFKRPKRFTNPIPYKVKTQGLFDVPGTILPTGKVKLPGITPDVLKEILPIICDKDTSYDSNGWSPTNPLWGHSAVVALLVQELYGGEIVRAPLSDFEDFKSLKSHYWNILPDGTELDLTKEQFGNKYPNGLIPKGKSRESLLSHEPTAKRYKLIASRLAKLYRFVLND